MEIRLFFFLLFPAFLHNLQWEGTELNSSQTGTCCVYFCIPEGIAWLVVLLRKSLPLMGMCCAAEAGGTLTYPISSPRSCAHQWGLAACTWDSLLWTVSGPGSNSRPVMSGRWWINPSVPHPAGWTTQRGIPQTVLEVPSGTELQWPTHQSAHEHFLLSVFFPSLFHLLRPIPTLSEIASKIIYLFSNPYLRLGFWETQPKTHCSPRTPG